MTSTGDLAQRLGISARVIRHWIGRGLLSPETHTDGGHARFSPCDVRRVRILCAIRRAGVRHPPLLDHLLRELHLETEAIVAEEVALSRARQNSGGLVANRDITTG